MGYHKGPVEDLGSQSGGTEVGEKAAGVRRTYGGGDDDLQRNDLIKCLKACPGIEMPVSFGLAGSISDQREEKS